MCWSSASRPWRAVPHYWEHIQWVWGARNMEEFMQIAAKVTLDGVLDRVKVPFLVTHGERDRIADWVAENLGGTA